VVRRAAAWPLGIRFNSLDELVAATGYHASRQARLDAGQAGRSSVDEVAAARRANDVLSGLLALAGTDDLAARVVLQRLLPGLFAIARRWQRRCGESCDAVAEVVSAAWGVIREYPLERRPHHLVANLLHDSEYRAFIKASRRMLVQEPVEPSRLDLPGTPAAAEPWGELAEVVACTALTAHDRRLLGLLLSGRSTVEVAAALHVSERTVRSHRESMVARMRHAVAA
jgi:DNA-binding CsgD family transcriptional regulator